MFVHVLFCAKFFGAELTKAMADGRAPADRAKLTEERFTKARVRF
jgi:hypothetical protein